MLVALLAQFDGGVSPAECFSARISANRATVFLGDFYPPRKVPPRQLVFVLNSTVRTGTFRERVDGPGPCESSESNFLERTTAIYRVNGRAPKPPRGSGWTTVDQPAVAFESSIGRFKLVSPRSQQAPRDPDALAAVLERDPYFKTHLLASPDGGTPDRQMIRRLLESYDSRAVGPFEELTPAPARWPSALPAALGRLLFAGGELRWERGYGFVWFITLDGRPGWVFESCVDGSGCALVLEAQRADGGVERVASCGDDYVECASP